MTVFMMLCCSFLQLPDVFADRIAILKDQVAQLESIQVEEGSVLAGKSLLEEVRQLIEASPSTDEAFDALYYRLDLCRQWLWDHAADRPRKPHNNFQEEEDCWRVGNELLTLRLEKSNLAMTVNTAKQCWRFAPSRETDLKLQSGSFPLAAVSLKTAEAFQTGYGTGMTLLLKGYEAAPDLEIHITLLLIGSEIVMDLVMNEPETGFSALNWPPEVTLEPEEKIWSVVPRMQGMLLPGNWSHALHQEELVHSRTLYMPWWGHVREGCGVQIILETTDDVGAVIDHPAGGPTRIWTRWHASLGRFNYLRTVRMVFDDESDYVTMAKRYRKFVQERGRWTSLAEKLLRTPNLRMVIGKPVIHVGALYHFVPQAQLFNKNRVENNHSLQTFDVIREKLEALSRKGVSAAYVHLDGWGYYGYDNAHPDPLPVGALQGGWDGLKRLADSCAAINYLFAVHDQYRDFYKNAASFDERLAILRADGTKDECSVWCGGPQTILNARFAPDYVRKNHDLFKEHGISVKGAYLDVFSVVPLEESARPAHPMSRAECARYRLECFELLRARGYVVSSEEPVEYAVNSLDLVHHAPYPTYPNIGGGEACGIPVPLFNLVYHDALLVPWDFGEDGGWGIPDGDAGRLYCLLHAGLPYLDPSAEAEVIERTLEAAAWSERCAFSEMQSHEFVGGDFRKQRAVYANGASVFVDFDTKEYVLTP